MSDQSSPPDSPSREQMLYWLHEAAEIEHNLMCCYLYATYTLKRNDSAWTESQRTAVNGWRKVLTSVAMEEMSHLCLVGNLMHALGAPPHMNRPAFPIDSGPYPAGFVIRLGPFCQETIEHFKFLERPATAHETLPDGAGFEPQRQYRRVVPKGRLSPGPRDYNTVGELYETLSEALAVFARKYGEAALFIGDPALQVDATLAPLPGVIAVHDLASAQQAIRTIVTQGEGAGSEHLDSHFCRFTRVGDELADLLKADPTFSPAWPAATNPVMNAPVMSADNRVHIDHPDNSRWLDIGNALYTTSLRCLLQGFDARERKSKASWLAVSFALMRMTVPVGQGLAARPASAAQSEPHGGLTFTPLRTLARLPADSAASMIAERLEELKRRAIELPLELVEGETADTWHEVIGKLTLQQSRLREMSDQETEPKPVPVKVAPATTVPAAAKIEIVRGKDLTIFFDAGRCIHSRHCVLDAPTVFKANTPGEWIYPDAIPVDELIAVAHNCPSGAIRYELHDASKVESAPAVNTIRIRENGPYAIHAPLTLAHKPDGFRATLCRCGQSKNKPWCDSSHVAAGFVASGEPPSGKVDALTIRNGEVAVTPTLNGPLHLEGNMEICAGTGRTVARVTDAFLCRCGQSRSKPFCDGSHVIAGFIADGD
ncbi:CDGSH-type Zn-finger protein/uncharacterized Fe-S cluster protein YjdI [Oxalobacteraceae bacterium GrIS 2.11]